MPCGVWTITDVPSDKVGKVEAEFALDSPVSVTKERDANGKWTVTAKFAPCPPGKAQTTTKGYATT